MKFLLLTLLVCCAIFMAVAVPVDESIPEGIEGAASDVTNPSDDSSFLLKIALLKKLLLFG